MTSMDPEAADRLLAKLRRFAAQDLDDEERAVLARLLAPRVSLAFDESEVAGLQRVESPEDALGPARAGAHRVAKLGEIFGRGLRGCELTRCLEIGDDTLMVAALVHGCVARDREHPRAETVCLAQGIQLFERAQECLLDDVGHRFAVAD